MRRFVLKAIVICLALYAALITVPALAQSDLEPPTLVELSVSPEYVDTSIGDQVITVTAHITDNLSGCNDSGGSVCLSVLFVPRFGPKSQRNGVSFTFSQLLTGTLTDGIYQKSFVLPQYSYEGEWILEYVVLEDRVHNHCGVPYPTSNGYCPFALPQVRFINKLEENLNFLPLLVGQ